MSKAGHPTIMSLRVPYSRQLRLVRSDTRANKEKPPTHLCLPRFSLASPSCVAQGVAWATPLKWRDERFLKSRFKSSIESFNHSANGVSTESREGLERLGIAETAARPLSTSKIEEGDSDHILLTADHWAILNIAAAFKAGFVGNAVFPSLVASGPAEGELTEEVVPG
ncbi:hypothetical protein [Bradyrhizobium sp. ARR65]|uniref:hypothetical protein n=1 Tax=Bradyrhizobium sp. ARR65 TaxID=1040989 RepID=UPI0012F7F459|nr:hypothetical protein [Bradyrhizobium sp. ARR65]